MPVRFSTLAVDCTDARLLADFWCAALGWRVLEADDGGIAIGAPDGSGPTIDLLPVPGRRSGKNRLHLDLRADGTTQAEEVQRLLGLGATHADVGQGPDVSWVVLADPEGNEFCVLSRSVQDVAAGVPG